MILQVEIDEIFRKKARKDFFFCYCCSHLATKGIAATLLPTVSSFFVYKKNMEKKYGNFQKCYVIGTLGTVNLILSFVNVD